MDSSSTERVRVMIDGEGADGLCKISVQGRTTVTGFLHIFTLQGVVR